MISLSQSAFRSWHFFLSSSGIQMYLLLESCISSQTVEIHTTWY